MPLEFRQFSGDTPREHLVQAATLLNNEIYADHGLPLQDMLKLVDPVPGVKEAFSVFDGEEVVAFGVVDLVPSMEQAELVSLAVRPEDQGRGIAKYLLRRIEQYVASHGGRTMSLYPNNRAQSFYTAMGYGEPDEEHIMWRQLPAEITTQAFPLPDAPVTPAATTGSSIERTAAAVEREVQELQRIQRSVLLGNMLLLDAITELERILTQPGQPTAALGNLIAANSPLVDAWRQLLASAEGLQTYRLDILGGG